MNETFKRIVILILILISLVCSFYVIIKYNAGSNADINKEECIAKIICYDDNTSTRVTWEFYKLSDEEYSTAISFADRNNCTFESDYNNFVDNLNKSEEVK